MSWNSTYIIYRIDIEAKLVEVFSSSDMKKAKYWLQYIAQPGDILCRTPAHPKLAGKTVPEYWQHKEGSGQQSTEEASWKTFAQSKNFNGAFPDKETGVSA